MPGVGLENQFDTTTPTLHVLDLITDFVPSTFRSHSGDGYRLHVKATHELGGGSEGAHVFLE